MLNGLTVLNKLFWQLATVMQQSFKIALSDRGFLAGYYWAYVRIKCSLFPLRRNIKNLNHTKELALTCRQDLGVISKSLSDEFSNLFLKRIDSDREYESIEDYFSFARAGKYVRSQMVDIEGEHQLLKAFFNEINLLPIVMEYLDLNKNEIMFSAKIDSCVKLAGHRHLRNGYDDALEFHRDVDSLKFVKVFVYLNDIKEGNGHHEIFLGSNQGIPMRFRILDRFKIDEIKDVMPELDLCRVVGPKGYSWIEDTTSLHRGTVPEFGNRLMLSLSFNDAKSVRYLYKAGEYYDLMRIYDDRSPS